MGYCQAAEEGLPEEEVGGRLARPVGVEEDGSTTFGFPGNPDELRPPPLPAQHLALTSRLQALQSQHLAFFSGPHVQVHTQGGNDWPNSFLLRLPYLHLACIPSDMIDGMTS